MARFDAYDCATVTRGGYRFGTEPERIAEQLRAFADAIAKGDVLLQRVITIQRAKCDNFTDTRILFDVVERDTSCPPLT